MATLKAIRRRIASVRSTQQITRAMKLVAASKLRRAQEALINARPYHEALRRVADSLLLSAPEVTAPPEGAKRENLIVIVSSDRGLCGGYNANVIRAAEEQARKSKGDGLETKFFAVGRKSLEHLRRTRQPLDGERINNVPRMATVGLARELAAHVLTRWRAGEVTEAGVVYSSFKSALSQRPIYERLLPVTRPEENGSTENSPTQAREYLVEPSAAELVPVVLRRYLEASMLHALLEADASFFGAQMTAMDSATNNAVEMISRLTLEMNRARQASITKELMDIVGGAEALRAQA